MPMMSPEHVHALVDSMIEVFEYPRKAKSVTAEVSIFMADGQRYDGTITIALTPNGEPTDSGVSLTVQPAVKVLW